MRRLYAGGAILGALAALLCAFAAHAQEAGLPVKALDWPNDTQFEYAIYNGSGDRTATAYYRILKEKTGTRSLYHFKYMGRNDKMSESAEVWVEPATMHPVRSTRKLISGGRTLFVDCAYTAGKIVVRHKYAGQAVTQLDIPSQQPYYDFEQLMWIPAQIQWTGKQQQTYINYFNTFRFQPETTVVFRDGLDKVEIAGKVFPSTRYHFTVGATQYNCWTVNQNGHEVPAKIFMDDADDRRDVTFLDLKLNMKHVKASPEAWAAKPLPPPAQVGLPQPSPIPLPPPPPSVDPNQPFPDQPPPDELAPPPDDNRFPPPPHGGNF